MRRADTELLEELISYTTDKELKKQAYEIMRNRVMEERNAPRSFIVNEIVGVCNLVYGVYKYFSITNKMNKDT